jgi:uncharacterized Tic20 family protein
VLRTDRVQNSIRDVTRHNAHDRQNLEANDDVNFVLFFFVIDLRIEFFVVVVVVSSFAFVVSIVSLFVELIAISLELLAMLARRVIFLLADNTHFDDDDDDILDF